MKGVIYTTGSTAEPTPVYNTTHDYHAYLFQSRRVGGNLRNSRNRRDCESLPAHRCAHKKHRKWFAEEWIHPHERFYRFTDDKRCPPIIRICGRSKVHFVVLSPVYFESAGISSAGWGHRKYIWLDFDGVIMKEKDLNLTHAGKLTRRIVAERSVGDSFCGEKIEGIRELIDQVNREISPKLQYNDSRSWSVDGIFDENNKFIVVEMNKAIAPEFIGVTWKKIRGSHDN